MGGNCGNIFTQGYWFEYMRKVRNDIIFIVVLLLGVSLAALAIFLFSAPGDRVTVTVGGEKVGEYSLDEDRVVEIKSVDGYNILVIEGGVAYVKDASCPDGICSSHRPVSRGGESIICLPNEVVIEVYSADKTVPEIDIIN